MGQDHCPFTRTNKNNKVRYSPPNARVAACFQLYDDLVNLYGIATMEDDEAWVKLINQLKTRLHYAKAAKNRASQEGIIRLEADIR